MWVTGVESAGPAVFVEPSGAAAASLCECFAAHPESKARTQLLNAIAEEEIAKGQDPWAALLQALELPAQALTAAFAAASHVISEQLRRLESAPIPPAVPEDSASAAAWQMADAVRATERKILNEAAAAVSGTLESLR